jgi:hypothetical protein
MLFTYLLAAIGFVALLALSAVALFGGGRRLTDYEPGDAFDAALGAVSRLHDAAWRAINELKSLDDRKE